METSREQKKLHDTWTSSNQGWFYISYVVIKTVRDNTNATHWFKQVLCTIHQSDFKVIYKQYY